MFQNRIISSNGKISRLHSGRPPPPRRLLAFPIAASGRWTLGSFFEWIRNKPHTQPSEQPLANIIAQHPVKKQTARLAPPATFQRLGPGLVVLLDPKHNRLVYLYSVEKAASADAVANQLRGLLQAADALYVHLMALPSELQAGLMREFPGGEPILTNVPLPADLGAAFHKGEQGSENPHGAPLHHSVHSNVRAGDPGVVSESQWARGGVLELLYGSPGRHHAGPAVESMSESTAVTAEALYDEDAYDGDMPDEVLSRRKTTKELMAWRKGASMSVALRRSERTPYRFDWLIQGLNSIDQLSVVVATPNLILIRNNVDANLGVDFLYQPEEGDEDKPDVDKAGTTELRVEGSGALPEGLAEGLTQVLKAVGILGSNSDDEGHDSDDENKGGDSDDEEENVDLDAIFSRLVQGSVYSDDKDGDCSDAEAVAGKQEEEKEEEQEGDTDVLTTRALLESVGRQGPFRELMPGVFVRVVDAGAGHTRTGDSDSDDDDEDSGAIADNGYGGQDWDMANTLDVQLSPGPMGWTASVRVGRDGSGADAAARREALLESLRADAEYIQNMRRLEALWEKQAQESNLLQAQQRGKGRSTGDPSPLVVSEEDVSGVRDGSVVDGVASAQGLEADWRQAERWSATSATSSGPGHLGLSPKSGLSAAAASGAVPTDHLIQPPKRPGTAAPASAAADEGPNETAGGAGEGFEPLMPSSSPSPEVAEADGFVTSTRCRRAAPKDLPRDGDSDSMTTAPHPDASSDSGDGEESSDAAADGTEGQERPVGRSRMVRRPRGRTRLSRQLPGPSGLGTEVGTIEGRGASIAMPSSPVTSSTPKEAVAGQGMAAGPDAETSSSGSDANDAVAIPAYRHTRHMHNGAGTGAGTGPEATGGPDSSGGASSGSRAPWQGRAGPAAPMSQGAGLGSGAGTSGLPPEAAGYVALDLEQLAQFVLGRQASPEEVQDLARAVAQSAEVEDAFGGIAGGQPHTLPQQQQQQQEQQMPRGFRTQSRKHPWRRPGTPPPSIAEMLSGVSRSRRSVITPQRMRLRIPEQVLELAAARWPLGSQRQPGQLERSLQSEAIATAVSSGVSEPALPQAMAGKGRRLLSGLMLRRLGQRRAAEEGSSVVGPAAGTGQHKQLQQRPESQDDLAAVMVDAFRAASSLEREAAEVLVDFLSGRRHPSRHSDGAQHGRVSTNVFRSRMGLPGLVRGRDAVVVLPQTLLEATVGFWQEQEQRLMHEDYQVGR